MKYLKTFAGLFAALYIPLMIVIAIVMKPRDPKVTSMEAATMIAPAVAVLIGIVALGFALVSWVMDKQSGQVPASRSKAPASKKAPTGASYKKKKKKKK